MAGDSNAIPGATPGTWEVRARALIQTLVRPLVADGGTFDVETCDPQAHRVVLRARFAECDACAMTAADLATLLSEGLHRSLDPAAVVDVV